MSKYTISQYNWFFHEADENKDGFISLSELQNVLNRFKYSIDKNALARVFREADLNNDAQISYSEYMYAMGRPVIDGSIQNKRSRSSSRSSSSGSDKDHSDDEDNLEMLDLVEAVTSQALQSEPTLKPKPTNDEQRTNTPSQADENRPKETATVEIKSGQTQDGIQKRKGSQNSHDSKTSSSSSSESDDGTGRKKDKVKSENQLKEKSSRDKNQREDRPSAEKKISLTQAEGQKIKESIKSNDSKTSSSSGSESDGATGQKKKDKSKNQMNDKTSRKDENPQELRPSTQGKNDQTQDGVQKRKGSRKSNESSSSSSSSDSDDKDSGKKAKDKSKTKEKDGQKKDESKDAIKTDGNSKEEIAYLEAKCIEPQLEGKVIQPNDKAKEPQIYTTKVIETHYEQTSSILKVIFNKYDTDNSGNINRTEIKTLFKELNQPMTDEEIDFILRKEGIVGDTINFEEFVRIAVKDHSIEKKREKTITVVN